MIVKKFTKEEIIHGFKSKNSFIINSVYQDIYPTVESYVSSNSGGAEDASDIFQDAMKYIFEKARLNKLFIRENVNAFIISACKYQWLSKLNEKRRNEETIREFAIQYYQEIEWEDEAQRRELLFDIVNEHLGQMKSRKCKNVLKLFFNGFSYSKMVAVLGIGSQLYAKSLKYRCIKRLIETVLNDSRLRSLFN